MDMPTMALVAKVYKKLCEDNKGLYSIDENGVRLTGDAFFEVFPEYEEGDYHVWAYKYGVKFYSRKSAWRCE